MHRVNIVPVPSVAVGEAAADPIEVVLNPLGRSGRGVGVVADRLPADVNPLDWSRSNAFRMVAS